MRPTIVPTFLALCLSACGASQKSTDPADAANPAQKPAVQSGSMAKLNPQPQRSVDVVLSIRDSPGPFAMVGAIAQYDVVNEDECGQGNGADGSPERITRHEPFALKRLTASEYRGTVYFDLIQDEDYYNRGVCRWQLTAMQANLRATGAKDETMFRAIASAEQLQAREPAELYFWKGAYPRSSVAGQRDAGHARPEAFPPAQRGQLFSLVLQAEQP